MELSQTINVFILIGAALLLLSLLASKLGGRLGVPGLLLFLLIGMLAGSEGLGGIDFEDYAVTQTVGTLALTFILFNGGLETSWASTRPVLLRGLSLATLGVLVTTGLVAVVAHVLLGLPWLVSLLMGAVVSSTDASAVFSVLRERALAFKGQVRPLLEFESGINDPMAVFLTLGLISLILNADASPLGIVPLFFQQMLIGGALGYALGHGAVRVLNNIRLSYDGLYPVLTVAIVGVVYGLTAVLGGSGFLAVYVAAVVLGNSDFIHKRSLRQFHEGVSYLLEIVMFLLLGLLVFPSQLVALAGPALLISLFLMFVARPAAIYLGLALSPMPLKHKSMVAWVGLRGAVPVILATFPLLAGVPGAQVIFNVAFFIVLTSILIQGTSLPLAARLLRVNTALETPRAVPLEFTPTGAGKNDLVEVVVPPASSVIGQRIVDLHLPPEALIVLIHRQGEYIVPKGATTIEEGDAVTLLGPRAFTDEVRERVAHRRLSGPDAS